MKCYALLLLTLWPALAMANPDDEVAPEPESEAQPLEFVGELTMDFRYRSVANQESNEFEMRRAEVGIKRGGDAPAGGEILLEALRSAGPDSFSGIDGDSLIIRLNRAWGYARQQIGPIEIEGRAGLLLSPWIETAEAESQLRFIDRLAAERMGVYASSDFGALMSAATPEGRLRLQVAVFNGEGRNQIEQNNGKNLQIMASGTILEGHVAQAPWRLRLHLGGQEGSLGPGAAANHRLSAGLSAVHETLAAGAELHFGFGLDEVSSRDSRSLGLWGRARWRSLSAVLRYDNQREDLHRALSTSHFFLAGIFVAHELDSTRLRLGVAGRWEKADENASPVPGLSSVGDVKTALILFSSSFGGY